MNNNILDRLTNHYPALEHLRDTIAASAQIIIESYKSGGKTLICGNGGSCADSDHIAGELMKSFERERPLAQSLKDALTGINGERGSYLADKLEQGLPAISLNAHSSLISAISNDIGSDLIFAQQVAGFGNSPDILLAITTSGNSQNVIDAAITARAKGLKVIGLTGETGGRLKEFCNIIINVPETETASVQELHLPVYHAICRLIEDHFFGKSNIAR